MRSVTRIYDHLPEIYRNFDEYRECYLLRILMKDKKELVVIFDTEFEKRIWQQGLQYFIINAMDKQIMGYGIDMNIFV